MFEELIKAELKKRGLSEGLFSLIKVEKQEDIEKAVATLASEVDRRVTSAVNERDTKIKTLETDLETAKKTPPKDGETVTDPATKKDGDPDLAAQLKAAVAEAVTGLKKELEETYGKQLGELTAKTKSDQARAALTAAKLDPDKYLKFVDLDKIEDSVKEVSELFIGERKTAVDEALKAAGRPISSSGADAAVDVKAFAAAKNAGASASPLPAKPIPGAPQPAAPPAKT